RSRMSRERTYDDPRDPRDRRRSLNNRKTSSKGGNSRRKSNRRTSEIEEKLAKFEGSPSKEKGRGSRKSSTEKGEKASAEKEGM
ncbi:hypothetical protein PMAYCL1PPCAC_02211, partial [Pristionchus mayeri]